jgi:hypothetical protein
VKLLLPHMSMAAVNQQEKENDCTALHKAAACGDGYPAVIELLVCHGADMTIKSNGGFTALQVARGRNHPVCARMLDPHDLLPLLLPWSVERSRGIHDGAVVRTSTNGDGATTVQRARLTYPPPFNLAALTLFRQVSPHCAPAIAPNPARGVLGIGRMKGMPSCPVKDPITQEVRDVDLLQEHIFASGLLDLDWFTQDPARRLRTWLPAPQRLALRRWEVGDRVEVCGLTSAPELNGRMAVVKAYLPKQRRFECVLDEEKAQEKVDSATAKCDGHRDDVALYEKQKQAIASGMTEDKDGNAICSPKTQPCPVNCEDDMIKCIEPSDPPIAWCQDATKACPLFCSGETQLQV